MNPSRYVHWAVLLLVVLGLTGCAGRNFVRPQDEKLALAETTYDQVIATYGDPRRMGTLTRNGVQMKVINYSYAEATPFTTGLRTRAMSFVFDSRDLLVSYDYVSSFDGDMFSPKIDEAKTKQIVQGQKKSEVIAIMGIPSGEAIFPVVDQAEKSLIRYNYLETWRIPFGFVGPRINRKLMLVTFDKDGIVSEVKFEESNQN
jgi:hypothetical protein